MSTAEQVEILAQADLLLFLARIFSSPSSGTLSELGIDESEANELTRRAGLTARSGALQALQGIRLELEDRCLADWMEEHARLFEAAGCCPINETAYVRRDKGAILADISGFHRAFGFELSTRAGEKADHLACELEFAALLLVMQAQALSEERETEVEICRGALASFARDHLDEWLPLFCDRLHEQARLPLFKGGAGLLAESWEAIVARRSLPRAESPAIQSDPEDSGTPYECGLSD